MHPEAVETCAVVATGIVAIMSFGAGWLSRGRVEQTIRSDYRSLFAACQHAVRANGTEQAPRDLVPPAPSLQPRAAAAPSAGREGALIRPARVRACNAHRDVEVVAGLCGNPVVARSGAPAQTSAALSFGAAREADPFVQALTRDEHTGDVLAEVERDEIEQEFDEALTRERDARAVLEELAAEKGEPEELPGNAEQQLEVIHEDEVFALVPARRSRDAARTKAFDVRALLAAVGELRGDDAGSH